MIILHIMMVLVMVLELTAAVSHEQAWDAFMEKYPMDFGSINEIEIRKKNFYSAHDIIEEHNNKPNVSYQLDHNAFSLMSDKEIQAYLGLRADNSYSTSKSITNDMNHTRFTNFGFKNDRALPASVDWRNDKCMQPVKNQGKCGSCWAFATTNVVEFDFCAKTGNAIALSEQQLVSCDSSNGGCNGGNAFNAFRYVAKAGLLSHTVYPYTSSGGSRNGCNYNPKNVIARVSSRNPYTSIAYNSQRMMQVLANKGVVLVALCVTRPFMSYKSGVFTDNSCGKCPRNHAVVAVGYGTLNNIPYWIIRNSWSGNWGDKGYVLVQRGVDLCQIESDAMYTTII